MAENRKVTRDGTAMVPVPSDAHIPERDLNSTPVLECRHLGIDFGGLTAVDDFNVVMGKTEISGLIGPNGAGKTTVFNLLTKVYQPTRGAIILDGIDTAGMTTPKVAQAGIARTFQNIRLFDTLTVEDNVKIGLHNQVKCGMWSGIFRAPRYWLSEKEFHEKALELLDIFNMADNANDVAGSLPYGAQRRLEIVRALATNPKLLLLDEPAAGMNPAETAELMENIRRIRDEFQIAILLIEHDMDLVMGICEYIAVLNFGKIIAKGTAEEIQSNPQVIEAYLGKQDEPAEAVSVAVPELEWVGLHDEPVADDTADAGEDSAAAGAPAAADDEPVAGGDDWAATAEDAEDGEDAGTASADAEPEGQWEGDDEW